MSAATEGAAEDAAARVAGAALPGRLLPGEAGGEADGVSLSITVLLLVFLKV